MYEQPLPDFTSPDWCGVLYRYAKQLSDVYSANLAWLSDTGIELEAENRIALTIDPFQGENALDDRRNPRRSRGSVMHELQSAMIDSDFFEKWHKDAKPLLVLAPFGCGKSILLADFTCRFAKRLMDWCKKPNGLPPWVPFPVRLRGWQRDTLEQYIEGDAQSHVNRTGGQFWLSAKRIRHLRNAKRFLPLFDGFDELSYTVNADGHGSNVISDIWLMYPDHHVLSSRPGDGAEESKYQSRGTVHQLRDLDERAATQFIVQRLDIAAGDVDDPALLQYRAAQPHINDLFRRPLFLAAWCARAKKSRRNLPTTISGLMDVVLGHVLDQRIAENRKVDYRTLRRHLLENRHYLGVILAIHADAGFNVAVTSSGLAAAIAQHPLVLTEKSTKRLLGYALKAGLVLEYNEGTYTQKIPIVEYLIGCYYAWLAENHHKQLMMAFQQRFWWRDHNEVWLHAFDLMWHGGRSQQNIAAELVQWVLNLSRECLIHANWECDLSAGQEDQDREPWTCWRLALRVLLPATEGIGGSVAGRFIDEAMKQCDIEARQCWNIQGKAMTDLEGVAKRRPEMMNRWLCDCLGNPEYRIQSPSIVNTIGRLGKHLINKPTVDRLMECLRSREYEDAWSSIASILEEVAEHLSPEAAEQLLIYVGEEKYAKVWPEIAFALRQAAVHLGSNSARLLLMYLRDDKHEDAWLFVAGALAQVVARRGADPIEQLLVYLCDDTYKKAWGPIASALGSVAASLGPDGMKLLLTYLGDDKYTKARPDIGFALCEASSHLGSDAVEQLLTYLGDDKFKEAWWFIANALWPAAVHLRQNDFNQLLLYLDDNKYVKLSGSLASVLGQAAAHLGPAAAKQLLTHLDNENDEKRKHEIAYALCAAAVHLNADDFKEMLTYLRDNKYNSWLSKADALGQAAMRLGPVAANQLLTYLGDDKYEEAWLTIAAILSRAAPHLSPGNVRRLLTYLGNEKWIEAWGAIAFALGEAAAHLNPDDLNQMLTYLSSGKYKESWNNIVGTLRKVILHLGSGARGQAQSIANDAARGSRISYAIRIADAVSLIWFVRDVDPQKDAGIRIEYGVAERNDADLILNPKFADENIQRLLGFATPDADPISNREILPILQAAVNNVCGTLAAAAFAYKLRNLRELSQYLNKYAIPTIEESLGEKHDQLRLKPLPIKRSRKTGNAGSNKKPPLLVNRGVLKHALDRSAELIRKLFADARIKPMNMPVPSAGFDMARFVCGSCSALNEGDLDLPKALLDLIGDDGVMRPKQCRACLEKFGPESGLVEFPENAQWCWRCATAFVRLPGKKTRVCPNPECQKAPPSILSDKEPPEHPPARISTVFGSRK